jgi:NaMN:DMB phosphoribosyltransferase
MPEPTTVAIGTLTGQALAVPVLTVAGIGLGLRPDVLLAGFSGAVAAMTLLNTVPASGDTLRELVRTTFKRVGVAVGSSLVAGYTAPLVALINGLPAAMMLGVSFIIGAGAMQLLPWLIERVGKRPAQGAQP